MRMTYVGHRRKGPREGGISSDRHCKFYVGTAAQSRVHNEYRKSACVLNNPKKWVMLLAPPEKCSGTTVPESLPFCLIFQQAT